MPHKSPHTKRKPTSPSASSKRDFFHDPRQEIRIVIMTEPITFFTRNMKIVTLSTNLIYISNNVLFVCKLQGEIFPTKFGKRHEKWEIRNNRYLSLSAFKKRTVFVEHKDGRLGVVGPYKRFLLTCRLSWILYFGIIFSKHVHPEHDKLQIFINNVLRNSLNIILKVHKLSYNIYKRKQISFLHRKPWLISSICFLSLHIDSYQYLWN